MAMITDLLAAVGAAVAAFFGHIVAHDFVEITPRIARSLIKRAIAILPAATRSRYQEEWLSHLTECTGVFAKLRHAFGCVRCARRLHRESMRHEIASRVVRVEVAGVGSIEIDGATSLWLGESIVWIALLQKLRWLWRPTGVLRILLHVRYEVTRIKLRKIGLPDVPKFSRGMDLIMSSHGAKIKIWINGQLVDLDDLD